MKTFIFSLVAVLALPIAFAHAQEASRPLNVAVVTGGHDYDEKAFPRLFEGHDGIRFQFVRLKDDSELFESIGDWKYDVIVLYNMTQRISDQRKANLLALLDRGVGLVALHHSIAAYSEWDEFARIIGGKYFLKPTAFEGKQWKGSTYKHDVNVAVHVAAEHPITRGVSDFVIHDETYKGQWIDPDATILLSTKEPTSDSALAWCKPYRNARTCYIQLGHGPQAYTDANYKRLLAQAIRWTAAEKQ